MMQTTQHAFPIHVRTGWIDFSPALQSYVSWKVSKTLVAVASRIRSVTVRIGNHDPQIPATRLCAIDVELKAGGTISTASSGRDIYDVVNDAADVILERMRGQRTSECPEPLSRIA